MHAVHEEERQGTRGCPRLDVQGFGPAGTEDEGVSAGFVADEASGAAALGFFVNDAVARSCSRIGIRLGQEALGGQARRF